LKSISRSDLRADIDAGLIDYLDWLAQGQGVVHPDVAPRMRELAKSLDEVVLRAYANSLVVQDERGAGVIAVAFGTAYSIQVGSMFASAVKTGAQTLHRWSDGSSLDLVETFGPGWIAGAWENAEIDWIRSGRG